MYLKYVDTEKSKMKGWESLYYTNTNQKRSVISTEGKIIVSHSVLTSESCRCPRPLSGGKAWKHQLHFRCLIQRGRAAR